MESTNRHAASRRPDARPGLRKLKKLHRMAREALLDLGLTEEEITAYYENRLHTPEERQASRNGVLH